MTAVLLVEDDETLGAQIVEQLAKAGFEARWIKDGAEAMRAEVDEVALVVLDLMLPGAYGLDVLKQLRKRSDVPVLILSARDETHDKVRGFELGADDYVTKPFWPEELVARIQARLRRPVLQRSDRVEVGPVALDRAKRAVLVRGAAVELTKVEFDLLAVLLERPGNAFTRSALVDKVLDPDRMGNERTLDVHVSRLRKKLGDDGARIETVWGIGYRFREEGG